jgi:hypothetical protein
VNSASGSHYYAKGETFFPLWTQYRSSGPASSGAFFTLSADANVNFRRASEDPVSELPQPVLAIQAAISR